jgi:inosose dehydratase
LELALASCVRLGDDNGVKVAFSKPTRNVDEQRQLFESFRSAGYGALQLKGGQYSRYVSDPEGFTGTWGDDGALTSGLITMGTLDEDGIAALRAIIGFGVATKAERVIFCHNHPREGVTAADIKDFARTLSKLGQEAADQGVRLSLHHHYQQPVMHRADFDVFFSAADHVGLTVDTSHLAKSGVTDIAGLIRDMGGVIDNIHVKDFADGEFRILGRGTLDFKSVMAALRDIDYSGWLCVDEESSASLTEGLQASRDYLRDELGIA